MLSNLCNSNRALVKNWCNTETEVDEVDFNWTIKNFNFHETKGIALKSSTFSATTNDKFQWYLVCKPNGENENKNSISIYLHLSNRELEKVFAEFTISAMNRRLKSNNEFDGTTLAWGSPDFIIKDQNFKSTISENNELMIYCNVKFAELKKVTNNFHQYKPQFSACNLSEDLASLFENQEFSDVILSVKDKNYHAHKIILAARSPVFAAMFRHNMKETEENRVIIEDINEDVMGEILRYIYTGKCQNLEKFAEKLLAAADKYALDRLKIICMEELFKTLSVENVANMLVLADLHGVAELKAEVIKFIGSNFAEVSKTTGWKNITNLELIREVCETLLIRR